jgi:hypothetical protein
MLEFLGKEMPYWAFIAGDRLDINELTCEADDIHRWSEKDKLPTRLRHALSIAKPNLPPRRAQDGSESRRENQPPRQPRNSSTGLLSAIAAIS